MDSASGHRSVPHTADTILEAWGPDLASCLAESCEALLEEFIEVAATEAVEEQPFTVAAPDAARLVAALLEEIIYVVDARGLVPSEVAVTAASEHECRGTMRLVPLEAASQIGSVPKSVSLSGLRVQPTDDGWTCRVVIDI